MWPAPRGRLGEIGAAGKPVQPDCRADPADRFSEPEKTAKEARAPEKSPEPEEGRPIVARWSPAASFASSAKTALMRAVEPQLIAETEKLQPPSRAGSALVNRSWSHHSPSEGDIDVLAIGPYSAWCRPEDAQHRSGCTLSALSHLRSR